MGIRKYLELFNNETSIYRRLYDIANVVLCGKFITLNMYIEKQGILKIIQEAVTIKKIKRNIRIIPKGNRMKEIVRLRVKINEMENKGTIRPTESKLSSKDQ